MSSKTIAAKTEGADKIGTDFKLLSLALNAPIDPKDIDFLPGGKVFPARSGAGHSCTAMAYADVRVLMDRMDAVFGFENWQNITEPIIVGGKPGYRCKVGVLVMPGSDWVWKENVAELSDFESVKGGHSDAMKRVLLNEWGVGGRWLYALGTLFGNCDTYEKGGVPTFKKWKSVEAGGPIVPAWYVDEFKKARAQFADLFAAGEKKVTKLPVVEVNEVQEPAASQPAGRDTDPEVASAKTPKRTTMATAASTPPGAHTAEGIVRIGWFYQTGAAHPDSAPRTGAQLSEIAGSWYQAMDAKPPVLEVAKKHEAIMATYGFFTEPKEVSAKWPNPTTTNAPAKLADAPASNKEESAAGSMRKKYEDFDAMLVKVADKQAKGRFPGTCYLEWARNKPAGGREYIDSLLSSEKTGPGIKRCAAFAIEYTDTVTQPVVEKLAGAKKLTLPKKAPQDVLKEKREALIAKAKNAGYESKDLLDVVNQLRQEGGQEKLANLLAIDAQDIDKLNEALDAPAESEEAA